MTKNKGRYAAGVTLQIGSRRKYLSSTETALDVFRRTPELDEATLRPVRGSDVEPATLRRTSQGAIVIHRRAE